MAAVLPFLPHAPAQQGETGSLHGVVRNAEGKPVPNASVSVQRTNSRGNTLTRTDSQGRYSFPVLPAGVYSLRSSVSGLGECELTSLFIAAREDKIADLVLRASTPHSSPPQFFDQPQFTVSGVTDTTNLGGHGSDTVVRTRDSIAKETASLGKSGARPSEESAALESSLRQQLQRAPADFDTNHRLGSLLLETGRSREAIPFLDRASQANPEDLRAAYDLALANFAAGDYARARDDARALLVREDRAEVHHLLADAEEKLGNSVEAVRQYERAALIEPTEPNIFDWGAELLLHHAPIPAEEVFSKGNRLFPASVRILLGLGATSFARGATDHAVQQMCQASDLDPKNRVPYAFLARILRSQAMPSGELVERLHRFVTLDPQNAEANYDYAVAVWKLKRASADKAEAEEIESLLETAIRLDPKYAPAELQLGIVLAEQGRSKEAVIHYQRAIELDSRMEEAHFRLAEAYRKTGESEKAKGELQIYQELSKQSARQTEREHREVRQFVYTLRDQPSPQSR